MIKSTQGETVIKGTNFDVTFDFDCIMRGLLLQHPEIVVSWLTNNEQLFDEAAHKCTKADLECADFAITAIARTRKELNNED